VEYIDQPIVRATSNGLVTADGKAREVDAVIAATGFQNGFLPWFPTIGKNGVDLRERWASDGPIGYPETYFGVMAPDMPNYFAVMQVGLLHINTLLILSVCRID
jgi:cation diffusion facilitator CzcD-associated flavoprotein CzcO